MTHRKTHRNQDQGDHPTPAWPQMSTEAHRGPSLGHGPVDWGLALLDQVGVGLTEDLHTGGESGGGSGGWVGGRVGGSKSDAGAWCGATLSGDLAAAELGDRERRGVGGLDDVVPAAVDHLALLLREAAPQDEHHALPAPSKGVVTS